MTHPQTSQSPVKLDKLNNAFLSSDLCHQQPESLIKINQHKSASGGTSVCRCGQVWSFQLGGATWLTIAWSLQYLGPQLIFDFDRAFSFWQRLFHQCILTHIAKLSGSQIKSWVALSLLVVCPVPSRIGNISTYLHYMMRWCSWCCWCCCCW